jgi:hypothetical protein
MFKISIKKNCKSLTNFLNKITITLAKKIIIIQTKIINNS